MNEPLAHFYQLYGFDKNLIEKVVYGEKYIAVGLKNGNLGVCATLMNPLDSTLSELFIPDLSLLSHRIFYNAYLNALVNHRNVFNSTSDIFDKIDFRNSGNVVMIGYFHSLAEKFRNSGIPLTIFDLEDQSGDVEPLEKQIESVAEADTVVLTSTSVFNQTFLSLVNSTKTDSNVYLLGPSTILHPEMFCYRNVNILFGSLFEKNKEDVIDLIESGHGTPEFSKVMRKVFLVKQ